MDNNDFKKKRKALGLTQDELGKMLGVSKRTIINYEKGEVIPATKSEILHNILNSENKNLTKKEIKPEAIQVDFKEMNVMFVPLVNQYAQAGYLNGFNDENYIDDLPKIPFANDREHRGEYLCFEVKGDSMDNGSYESILEGDILLCRNVRHDFWKSKLHINKWDFVIVHKDEGILVKRIINHDVEKGEITIHSLNDYYEDKVLHLSDIAKIFNIVDIRRKKNRR